MSADERHDGTPSNDAPERRPPGSSAQEQIWREIAEAFFAACTFDEFDSLYEVHAGDLRAAAERFRAARDAGR